MYTYMRYPFILNWVLGVNAELKRIHVFLQCHGCPAVFAVWVGTAENDFTRGELFA